MVGREFPQPHELILAGGPEGQAVRRPSQVADRPGTDIGKVRHGQASRPAVGFRIEKMPPEGGEAGAGGGAVGIAGITPSTVRSA